MPPRGHPFAQSRSEDEDLLALASLGVPPVVAPAGAKSLPQRGPHKALHMLKRRQEYAAAEDRQQLEADVVSAKSDLVTMGQLAGVHLSGGKVHAHHRAWSAL